MARGAAAGLGWEALWFRPDAALLLLLQRVVRRILLLADIARRILVCERVACLIPCTADGILYLARCPLSGAIGLELCIANDSAETFLHRPLDLVADSLDSILVHLFAPSVLALRMRLSTDASLFKTAHPAVSEA
jgi:hypothetical protein